MDGETIIITPEDVEIADASEYREELTEHFGQVPEVAKPLLKKARSAFSKIEKALYTAPAFINAVKAAVPEMTLQAVLTDEQKQQIAKGALKLMTKKDGSLMANLINPETKKIVTTIPLKSVQMAPEMSQAMTSFSTQMQMAQIAEQYGGLRMMDDSDVRVCKNKNCPTAINISIVRPAEISMRRRQKMFSKALELVLQP